MSVKVAINDFGRIGRLVYRAMANDPALDVVAVNDMGDIPAVARVLRYDSVHGRAFDTIEVTEDGATIIGGKRYEHKAAAPAPAPAEEAKPAMEPIKPEIAFPAFEKIDLRVGKVLEADKVK